MLLFNIERNVLVTVGTESKTRPSIREVSYFSSIADSYLSNL